MDCSRGEGLCHGIPSQFFSGLSDSGRSSSSRAQGDIAIARFFQRFPNARLDGDVEFVNNEFIRGIRSLPVAVGARQST